MSKKLIYLASFVLVLGLVADTAVADLVAYYPLNEEEGSTSVADDVWHHLAAVRDGTTALVYVDGKLDTTLTLPDGYDLSGTTQYNAYIGAVTDNRDPTGNTLEKLYTGIIEHILVVDFEGYNN